MKIEDLEKANKLVLDIEHTKKLLNHTKNQTVHRINFTFGNGSNQSTVCDDSDTVEQIKQLLIVKHTQKLTHLKEEFEKI